MPDDRIEGAALARRTAKLARAHALLQREQEGNVDLNNSGGFKRW